VRCGGQDFSSELQVTTRDFAFGGQGDSVHNLDRVDDSSVALLVSFAWILANTRHSQYLVAWDKSQVDHR
jgi:hypothetical protein